MEEVAKAIEGTGYWGDVEGIGLAVREALANAIIHGNDCNTEKMVEISIGVNENCEVLEELFSRYRGRLYNTALRLLGNPDPAEDALQDGLLAAFRKLSTFEGRSQFSTWLTSIVFNAAVMQLRRRRPEVVATIDEPLGPDQQPLAHRIPDPESNPEEIYARQERLQIVGQYFQSLPAPYRQAVCLCHML